LKKTYFGGGFGDQAKRERWQNRQTPITKRVADEDPKLVPRKGKKVRDGGGGILTLW